MSKRDLSPDSLEAQADALLAAADSMDIPDEIPMPGKSSRSGKAAKAARPEADHIMTDEEAKKAGIVRLDDKQVAALPAASWLMGQEKLRELLARGKKKGKLDSGELMEAVDDLNLESDQMDQLYDSLEALNIDIGTEEDLLPELPDDEPAAEEIADVEEEELVDPNSLVSNFSIDDPVRMYLKEIGKVPPSLRRKRLSFARPLRRVKAPSRSWQRRTSVWWFPLPSGMWAAVCCSWT